MCLSNIEKITPQEDIVCYKLFMINPRVCDSDMWSPFKSKHWKIGRMETLKEINLPYIHLIIMVRKNIKYKAVRIIHIKILLIYQLNFYHALTLSFANVLSPSHQNTFTVDIIMTTKIQKDMLHKS